MDEHQSCLNSVYLHAKEQLEQATERRNRHHQPTETSLLAPGTLVYKRSHPIGRHKIQDSWDPTVFVVVQSMDEGGRVYKIRPRDGTGPEKHLHRAELKVLSPLTIVPMNLTQSLPDPGLIETPPQQPHLDTVDDDSDSEVIITFQPGRLRVQTPSPIPPEQSSSSIPPLPSVEASEIRPSAQADTVATTVTSTVHERPKRITAGQHSNPFNLPRSVNHTFAVTAVRPQGPRGAHNSVTSTLYRPWY